MKQYQVMVQEFHWEGRARRKGDIIEALDTIEILTNVAIGNLKFIEAPEVSLAVAFNEPIKVEQQESSAVEEPAQVQATLLMRSDGDDVALTPPRRRYQRRDRSIDE